MAGDQRIEVKVAVQEGRLRESQSMLAGALTLTGANMVVGVNLFIQATHVSQDPKPGTLAGRPRILKPETGENKVVAGPR